MRRRVWAAILASVLAVVGAGLLYVYVRNADARAMAGQEPISVLVVAAPIAKGTAAESLGETVTVMQIPKSAVAADAVASVEELSGRVASVDLFVGEQVLSTRFVDPTSPEVTDDVPVPEGLQQVSLTLAPERALGNRLQAGDTVGVVVSLKSPEETNMIARKILVTHVQGAIGPTTDSTDPADDTPDNAVIVTLAVKGDDAQRIIFGAEHGSVWLSLQREGVPAENLPVVTTETVFE